MRQIVFVFFTLVSIYANARSCEERLADISNSNGANRLEFYSTEAGGTPFLRWYAKIRDTRIKERILDAFNRLTADNWKDTKRLHRSNRGENNPYRGIKISELRVDKFRIYIGELEPHKFVILEGGDKDSQERDIKRSYDLMLRLKTQSPLATDSAN